MADDCARKDHRDGVCKCLPECMWCGGRGQHVRERPCVVSQSIRYECVDKEACDARIKRSIILGTR